MSTHAEPGFESSTAEGPGGGARSWAGEPSASPLRARVARELELLTCDADHVTACFRSLFIIVWRRVTHRAHVEALGPATDRLVAARGRILLATVIEPGAELLNGECRRALASFLRRRGEEVAGSAVLLDGKGFLVAAQRSIATGIALLARQPFPHHLFAELDDAGRWLSMHGSWPRPAPEELVEAVRCARRAGTPAR